MNKKSVTKVCGHCHREFPATLEYFQSCKSLKDGLHSWCKECKRAAQRAYYKKWYSEHRDEALQRAKDYEKAHPDSQRARHQKWYQSHKELSNERAKANHRALRQLVIEHYGGKCQCCGDTQPEFLAVDHINGGGRKHRLVIGSNNLCRWLRNNNFPEGFQVLCHNCNMAKAFYGHCPHQAT